MLEPGSNLFCKQLLPVYKDIFVRNQTGKLEKKTYKIKAR